MADIPTRQYDLRSGRREELHVPVHIQMSEDSTFLKQLMATQGQGSSNSGQVSDISSLNESDCDVLIASSEDEQESETKSTVSNTGVASSDPTSSDGTNVSQQAINLQILSQLQAMGKRLDAMEQKTCKKSSDASKIKNKSVKPKSKAKAQVAPSSSHQETSHVPDLQSIRQDAVLQAQVAKRLKELTDSEKSGTKLKSLRGGPVEVMVANRVKWPHEYVLSGVSKERVTYDQLSVTQWVAGFGRIMKEEKNHEIKEHMLDYLVALFDDANDFSWDAAKASHAVLLCRMEQGEIKSYSEVEKIDRVRRANAQRHQFTSFSGQSKKFGQKNSKSTPCQYYNQGTCHQSKTHETRGVVYRHICSACFSNGKSFPHPENECKNKAKKQSKNE